MSRTRRRFAVLAAIAAVGVPLTVVAAAFACANLAVIKLNRASATPGTQVWFEGRNFNSRAGASPVTVRWNSRNGQVLFEGRPVDGKLSGTFTVPRSSNGYYIVVATQVAPNGRPASGTPGRAALRVRTTSARSARSSRSSRSVVAAPVTPPGGPGGPPAAQIVGLGLSGLLLAGGLTALAVRRRRTPPAPSAA